MIVPGIGVAGIGLAGVGRYLAGSGPVVIAALVSGVVPARTTNPALM